MKIPLGRPEAAACIRGEGTLRGMVKFYPYGQRVLVVAEICGLPKNDSGFFALHIHEGERCTGEDFADTGGHFNPGGQKHPKHAGDLHSDADDFHSQPAGNAGRKIGCGTICPFC